MRDKQPTKATGDAPVLLSVVVPTHNVGVYIDECLLSLQRQAIERMEIIVVDDHSEDDTVTRVLARASSDSSISLIIADTHGGALARNAGALRARGKFLIFIDGDDIVPDGAFSALLASLQQTGSDLACGRYLKFSASRTWDPTQNWPVYKEVVTATTLDQNPALIRGRACWNKMFRKDFWESESLSFPNASRSNDILPMTRALARAESIDILPGVVYLYRERPGSNSMTSRAAQADNVLSYLEQELACFDELESRVSPRTLRTYFNLLYQADLWVHVARFVPEVDRDGDPSALQQVSSLVARFIERTPWREWKRFSSARRQYLEFVAAGRFEALKGLDERGEIGRGEPTVDLESFGEIRAILSSLADEAGTFNPIILRGFRSRIADPLWRVEGELKDEVLEPLLLEVARIDAALPGWVRSQLTANERQLLTYGSAGDTQCTRDLMEAVAAPAPFASVTFISHEKFALDISFVDLPSARALRVVGLHRDTRQEVAGPWAHLHGSSRTAEVIVDTSDWKARGVWLLEVDVQGESLVVRKPVAGRAMQSATPSDRWARIRISRIKRAGHHVVLVREPAIPIRLYRSIAARSRAVISRGQTSR